LKVLVVDDSAVTRAILSQALLHSGRFELTFASDGEQAKLLVGKVELVITDWMMPKTDGLTLTRWIRDNEEYRHLPVIMITANDQDEESRAAAVEAGVDLFIEKTFAADEMTAAIDQAIAARGGTSPGAA
jgi:CheY-like chemotaxis protein